MVGMNTDWSRANEPWLRVRWARENAGFPNMQAAADSLGMRQNTYSAFERDPAESSRARALDHQSAIQFGKKYRVSWVWLLSGEGTPFDKNLTEAQQRAIQAMESVTEDEQQRAAEMLELFLRKSA